MAKSTIVTPEVFVEELQAFPNSVVPVPTAEAAFIGYTGKAERDGEALDRVPTRITSLFEFEACFGPGTADGYDLHAAMRLFFGNGGGTAWIVSVGRPKPVVKADFLAGLAALESVREPAILAAPDALKLLEAEYYEVARAMIAHCASLGSRMAILDLHGGGRPEANTQDGLRASLAAFRAALAEVPQDQRSFGAAYHPWIVTDAGTVPPSAAVARVWTMTDNSMGVWKAPANAPIGGATDVAIPINDAAQDELARPLDGLAVNPIRSFANRGILVWGARTLDGNSQDFRYIPARRTTIMLAQSIRYALRMYAFEANDAKTWAMVRQTIARFLAAQWRQGALQGARAHDAFSVQCGLGSTMTSQDILDGRMLVTVLVALLRPAEFVVLTFAQDMPAG